MGLAQPKETLEPEPFEVPEPDVGSYPGCVKVGILTVVTILSAIGFYLVGLAIAGALFDRLR